MPGHVARHEGQDVVVENSISPTLAQPFYPSPHTIPRPPLPNEHMASGSKMYRWAGWHQILLAPGLSICWCRPGAGSKRVLLHLCDTAGSPRIGPRVTFLQLFKYHYSKKKIICAQSIDEQQPYLLKQPQESQGRVPGVSICERGNGKNRGIEPLA